MPETDDFDAQDTAEVFDETNLTEDGEDIANFDEIVDVYDVTTALGDSRDVAALDEDEFDEDAVEDEDPDGDTDEDEEADDRLRDELEDVPEDDADPDTRDEDDGVTRLAGDESELSYVGDVDAATDPSDDEVEKYESSRVSDEELKALGYPDEKQGQDQAGSQGSGARPDDVADERHPRQEELLDEGIEESFPASDPVSVKRIT
jgi:hypothetical protein